MSPHELFAHLPGIFHTINLLQISVNVTGKKIAQSIASYQLLIQKACRRQPSCRNYVLQTSLIALFSSHVLRIRFFT